MNIDIRKSIKENFKDSTLEDFRSSITESISSGEELALPGLGVLFELLWTNSNHDQQENFLKTIQEHIKDEKL